MVLPSRIICLLNMLLCFPLPPDFTNTNKSHNNENEIMIIHNEICSKKDEYGKMRNQKSFIGEKNLIKTKCLKNLL